MINLIKSLYLALHYGEAVAKPAIWKNKQVLINNGYILFCAILAISCQFDQCFNFYKSEIKEFSENFVVGIGFILGLMNNFTHLATSKKVGLRGRKN